jgi:CheY-like chemotaxis protein
MRTSKFRILVVEDDEPKLNAVFRFLQGEYPDAEILTARSLSTAIGCLSSADVNLAIVDMSLPTYDVSIDKTGGGPPQGFGGEDVVRFIAAESPQTKSVVLTQYEEFSDVNRGGRKSLSELSASLTQSLDANFLGVLHYSSQQGTWRNELKDLIQHLVTSWR